MCVVFSLFECLFAAACVKLRYVVCVCCVCGLFCLCRLACLCAVVCALGVSLCIAVVCFVCVFLSYCSTLVIFSVCSFNVLDLAV